MNSDAVHGKARLVNFVWIGHGILFRGLALSRSSKLLGAVVLKVMGIFWAQLKMSKGAID